MMHKPFFKGILLTLFMAGALALAGCESRAPALDDAVPVSQKRSFTTCFGTVKARETYPVRFPFDIEIQEVNVRVGQVLSAGDVLFQADYNSLAAQQAEIDNLLASLEFQKGGYDSGLETLQNEWTVCKAGADHFSAAEIMGLLKSIATTKSRTAKLNEYRLALMEALDRYGLLMHYQDLLSYAMAKDKFYFEQANPLLKQMESQFDARLPGLQAQICESEAKLTQTENDLIPVRKTAQAVHAFLAGQPYGHMKLAQSGKVLLADSSYLVDTIHISPHTPAYADEPVLDLIKMDCLEAVCYVEEQLVKEIQPGASAQLSLYSDSTSIALGTVSFVSQKAIEINGETVVEVVISYEGDGFMPGYNIVAKISPGDSE